MKQLLTIGLLVLSNLFMTFAWYGHLKFSEWKWFSKLGLVSITLLVFTGFTLVVFKTETFRTNHVIGFAFLVLAVYFIFKK